MRYETLKKLAEFSGYILVLITLSGVFSTGAGLVFSLAYYRQYDISILSEFGSTTQIATFVGITSVFFVSTLYSIIVLFPFMFSYLNGGRTEDMFVIRFPFEKVKTKKHWLVRFFQYLRKVDIFRPFVFWGASLFLPISAWFYVVLFGFIWGGDNQPQSALFASVVCSLVLFFFYYGRKFESLIGLIGAGLGLVLLTQAQSFLTVIYIFQIVPSFLSGWSFSSQLYTVLIVSQLVNLSQLKIGKVVQVKTSQYWPMVKTEKNSFVDDSDVKFPFFFLLNTVLFFLLLVHFTTPDRWSVSFFKALGVRRTAEFIIVRYPDKIPDKYLAEVKEGDPVKTVELFVVFETGKQIFLNHENLTGKQDKPIILDKSWVIELGD